ncbi:MAG TPA: DUF4837 family protein [Flavobacterium sp.]|nr:DUF4837 family protein [Flavobacterium sp.]
MKNFGYIFIIAFVFISCKKKEIQIGKIEASSGAVNEVVVVIEDSLWNGTLGDSIRKILAAPIGEISSTEPIFDLAQYSPKNFDSKAKMSRNIVFFSKGDSPQFFLKKSIYATPQNFFFIWEKSPDEINKIFLSQADSIIKTIKQTELNEQQLHIAKNPLREIDSIKQWFAMTINVPESYQIKENIKNEIVWFQKDLPSGDVNLLIYEVAIPENHLSINQDIDEILETRDLIIEQYIYGNQPDSYIYTDYNFVPVIYTQKQRKLPAIEVRGKWAMENDFMTGPFISMVIKDDYYGRYLFLDGFVNNSFQNKRNQLLELEAIIKSVNFYE